MATVEHFLMLKIEWCTNSFIYMRNYDNYCIYFVNESLDKKTISIYYVTFIGKNTSLTGCSIFCQNS
jgi:hypothetical protein